MNDDGHTSSIKDKILTVDVKPGWKEGTRIIFSKEGDQVNEALQQNLLLRFKTVVKLDPNNSFCCL